MAGLPARPPDCLVRMPACPLVGGRGVGVSERLPSFWVPPVLDLRPLGRFLRCRRFGCVMLAGILRAHLARIHLGWRPWLSSRRTAPVVVGWFGSARRACSRDWRLDDRFPALLATSARQFPVNRPFKAGCFLARRRNPLHVQRWMSLNAPSGARCFLTQRRERAWADSQSFLMHLLVQGAF